MITGRTFAVAQFKKNGGYTIHYRNGVDDSEIDGEEIDLNFPEPPVIEGFVFVGWEIVVRTARRTAVINRDYTYTKLRTAKDVPCEANAPNGMRATDK